MSERINLDLPPTPSPEDLAGQVSLAFQGQITPGGEGKYLEPVDDATSKIVGENIPLSNPPLTADTHETPPIANVEPSMVQTEHGPAVSEEDPEPTSYDIQEVQDYFSIRANNFKPLVYYSGNIPKFNLRLYGKYNKHKNKDQYAQKVVNRLINEGFAQRCDNSFGLSLIKVGSVYTKKYLEMVKGSIKKQNGLNSAPIENHEPQGEQPPEEISPSLQDITNEESLLPYSDVSVGDGVILTPNESEVIPPQIENISDLSEQVEDGPTEIDINKIKRNLENCQVAISRENIFRPEIFSYCKLPSKDRMIRYGQKVIQRLIDDGFAIRSDVNIKLGGLTRDSIYVKKYYDEVVARRGSGGADEVVRPEPITGDRVILQATPANNEAVVQSSEQTEQEPTDEEISFIKTSYEYEEKNLAQGDIFTTLITRGYKGADEEGKIKYGRKVIQRLIDEGFAVRSGEFVFVRAVFEPKGYINPEDFNKDCDVLARFIQESEKLSWRPIEFGSYRNPNGPRVNFTDIYAKQILDELCRKGVVTLHDGSYYKGSELPGGIIPPPPNPERNLDGEPTSEDLEKVKTALADYRGAVYVKDVLVPILGLPNNQKSYIYTNKVREALLYKEGFLTLIKKEVKDRNGHTLFLGSIYTTKHYNEVIASLEDDRTGEVLDTDIEKIRDHYSADANYKDEITGESLDYILGMTRSEPKYTSKVIDKLVSEGFCVRLDSDISDEDGYKPFLKGTVITKRYYDELMLRNNDTEPVNPNRGENHTPTKEDIDFIRNRFVNYTVPIQIGHIIDVFDNNPPTIEYSKKIQNKLLSDGFFVVSTRNSTRSGVVSEGLIYTKKFYDYIKAEDDALEDEKKTIERGLRAELETARKAYADKVIEHKNKIREKKGRLGKMMFDLKGTASFDKALLDKEPKVAGFDDAEKAYFEARARLTKLLASNSENVTDIVVGKEKVKVAVLDKEGNDTGKTKTEKVDKTIQINTDLARQAEAEFREFNGILIDSIPAKEKGIIRKGLEGWANIKPRYIRGVTISPSVQRLAISSFAIGTGLAVGTGVGVLAGASMVSHRFARGLFSTFISGLVGGGVDMFLKPKAEKDRKIRLEHYAENSDLNKSIDLDRLANRERMITEELKRNERLKKRHSLYKAGAMVLAGAGTHLLSGATVDMYEGKGFGAGISEDLTRLKNTNLQDIKSTLDKATTSGGLSSSLDSAWKSIKNAPGKVYESVIGNQTDPELVTGAELVDNNLNTTNTLSDKTQKAPAPEAEPVSPPKPEASKSQTNPGAEEVVKAEVAGKLEKIGVKTEVSSLGAIETVRQLQQDLADGIGEQFGGNLDSAPKGIQDLARMSPEQLTIKLGLWKPGETAESAMLMKGDTITFEKGQIKLNHILTGKSEVLMDENGTFHSYYDNNGKMFDADARKTRVDKYTNENRTENLGDYGPVVDRVNAVEPEGQYDSQSLGDNDLISGQGLDDYSTRNPILGDGNVDMGDMDKTETDSENTTPKPTVETVRVLGKDVGTIEYDNKGRVDKILYGGTEIAKAKAWGEYSIIPLEDKYQFDPNHIEVRKAYNIAIEQATASGRFGEAVNLIDYKTQSVTRVYPRADGKTVDMFLNGKPIATGTFDIDKAGVVKGVKLDYDKTLGKSGFFSNNPYHEAFKKSKDLFAKNIFEHYQNLFPLKK